ncbi:hypothetical protein ES703_79474 [subsurface metagenome]
MTRIRFCPMIGEACHKSEQEIRIQKDTFFLAEPFSPENMRAKREFAIKIALEKVIAQYSELSLKVADEETKDPAIFCDICRMMQSSNYGIADISEVNPNVMLELGMMLALGKPVYVLVKKSEQDSLRKILPSDILWKRVIPYDDFIDITQELIKQLKNRPKIELDKSLMEESAIQLTDVDPDLAQLITQRFEKMQEEQNNIFNKFENLLEQAKLSDSIERKEIELPDDLERQINEMSNEIERMEPLVGFTEDSRGVFLRGNSYFHREQYEKAIEFYDMALSIDSKIVEAWHNRGFALDELTRYEEAVESYDKAIEINPDYRSAWHNKGVGLERLGRNEEALESYDKAIEINPDYELAWYGRGHALFFLHFFKSLSY